jgi:hypothetical protein
MMINWLLKNLGLHAEIDEVLYQKIHDNMMERMQDKVAEIRAQAVTALQRLQVRVENNTNAKVHICSFNKTHQL